MYCAAYISTANMQKEIVIYRYKRYKTFGFNIEKIIELFYFMLQLYTTLMTRIVHTYADQMHKVES